MRDAAETPPPVWSWRDQLRVAASLDAPGWVQFIKYGLAGGVALTVDLMVFGLASHFWFPVGASEVELGIMDMLRTWHRDLRVLNYLRSNLLAFLFSNAVAYVLNLKWVFQGGRHRRAVEISLFLLASLIAFVLGSFIGALLVGVLGWNAVFAKAGNVVGAVLINFGCRKFLVFQR